MRDWFQEAFLEAFDESGSIEVEEINEAPDNAVFVGMFLTGYGKASGVRTELRAWNVAWFVEGLIAKREVCWTREEALKAAGGGLTN